MILIDNKPFDSASLMKEYPQNSVEQQVLKTISGSTEKYRYNSQDQLKFELRLRAAIVKAAKDLYNSDLSFAIFRKSKSNPKYWSRTDDGGFKLKSDVKPSDAIKDIYANGNQYATECATAMIIVYYKALLDVFGEERFNKMFPRITLMNWHSIDPLLEEVGDPRQVKDVLLGDRGYFENPDVDPKTPEWQGENVIVLPDGFYYGHGIGMDKAENFIEALNENRIKNSTRSAYFMKTVGRPNFKKFFELYNRPTTRPASWIDEFIPYGV